MSKPKTRKEGEFDVRKEGEFDVTYINNITELSYVNPF